MGDFSKIRAHRRVYIQLSVGDGRSRGIYGKGLFPVLSYRNNRRRNRCRISPWHGYRNRRGRSSLVEQDSLRCFPAVSGNIEQPSKNGSRPYYNRLAWKQHKINYTCSSADICHYYNYDGFGGFNGTDEDKIRLIKILGGTKRQILTNVVIPSNVPVIFNALKINVGLSFVGVIVGEFLVGKAGLGYLIVYNSQIFKLTNVMVSVFVWR